MPTEQEKQERETKKNALDNDIDDNDETMKVESEPPSEPIDRYTINLHITRSDSCPTSNKQQGIQQLQQELELYQESIMAQKLALEILSNICSDYNDDVEKTEDMEEDIYNGILNRSTAQQDWRLFVYR